MKVIMKDSYKMKKKIIIVLSIILIIAASVFVFKYYHPTHYSFNDRFIIGNTEENIVKKYGEFYNKSKTADGQTIVTYKIRDNTPELIMSYDNSLWYEIYFEDGIATEVKLREGNIGG